jgi:hypothetical protein
VANAFLTRSMRMSPNQGHKICSIVAWTCARHLRQLIAPHFEANCRWTPSPSLEMRTTGSFHVTHSVLHLRVAISKTPFSCVLLIQAKRCDLSLHQSVKQVRDLDFGRCWHNFVDPPSSGASGVQQGPTIDVTCLAQWGVGSQSGTVSRRPPHLVSR